MKGEDEEKGTCAHLRGSTVTVVPVMFLKEESEPLCRGFLQRNGTEGRSVREPVLSGGEGDGGEGLEALVRSGHTGPPRFIILISACERNHSGLHPHPRNKRRQSWRIGSAPSGR